LSSKLCCNVFIGTTPETCAALYSLTSGYTNYDLLSGDCLFLAADLHIGSNMLLSSVALIVMYLLWQLVTTDSVEFRLREYLIVKKNSQLSLWIITSDYRAVWAMSISYHHLKTLVMQLKCKIMT